jgi:DinB superfamily
MSNTTIRPAYSMWPVYNQRLRDVVGAMTDEQLATTPAPGRWPLWATVGHTACQRVSGLCGLAGEPGAETTPFPNALYLCPGDEDLEHVLSAKDLVEALDSTFRIVDGCLDRWTLDTLDQEIRRQFDAEEWVGTRGSLIQRAFAHDIYHCAELNEAFTALGLPQIKLWD